MLHDNERKKNMKYQFADKILDTYEDALLAMNEYAFLTADQLIDDIYGEVEICGHNYRTSVIYKRVDPIAYALTLANYADSLKGEILEIEANEDDGED